MAIANTTPLEVMQRWGARISGTALRNPLASCGEGSSAAQDDDDLILVRYVRQTPLYDISEELLKWVYVKGKPLGEFEVKLPFETGYEALYRLGWWSYIRIDLGDIAEVVFEDFHYVLELRLRKEPLRFPVRKEDPTAIEIAEKVNEEVDFRYGERWNRK